MSPKTTSFWEKVVEIRGVKFYSRRRPSRSKEEKSSEGCIKNQKGEGMSGKEFAIKFKEKWRNKDIPCSKCGNYVHIIAFDSDMRIILRCIKCGNVTTLNYLIDIGKSELKSSESYIPPEKETDR